MRFAIVDKDRVEASPGARALCIGCGSELIAKCGTERINHWAHKGDRNCDQWAENETEWHRNWKNKFPIEWQEFRHQADSGEWHIADVKTGRGWAIEFQYSHLKPEERKARNAFYGKLAWVVSGVRLKHDQERFFSAMREIKSIESPFIRRICSVTTNSSPLLRKWSGSSGPIFFDFGEPATLWCLLPANPDEEMSVVEFSRDGFIALHRDNQNQNDLFAEFLTNLCKVIKEFRLTLQAQLHRSQQPPLIGFQKHLARLRPRRRF